MSNTLHATDVQPLPDPPDTPNNESKPRRRKTPVFTAALAVDEADASRYTGWSVSQLRTLRREGTGPAFYRVERSVRYRIADLDAWMAAHRVEPRGR